jgi:tRNA wybutosine-synthesizing protein 1
MLTKEAKKELEKQQYRIVGSHSAVKVCGWTKNFLRGKGGCYKLKFYGIMSHQCMQMSTSLSCANRCTFCWRGYKAPVSKDWKWGVDEPKKVLDGSIEEHHKLLLGFKGNDKVNKNVYQQSNTVKHVALSLTGEPITYPRINEFVDECNKKGISTFMVTNAQYADQIRGLNPVTQLYLSIDAPNKVILKEIDRPLFPDYWERMNKSLEYLAKKNGRTCIRLTMVKEINMVEPKKYARLIIKGDPDFLEVKAYMFVGASRQRLSLKNMPYHEEILEFTKELLKYLPDYEIVSDHLPSRVVMLSKKKFKKNNKWHTWIDFPKYQELALSGKDFTAGDYLKPTPQVGLTNEETSRKEKDDYQEMNLD